MKKLPLRVLLAIGIVIMSLCLGYIIGKSSLRQAADDCSAEQVLLYCKAVELTGWNISALQRSNQFLCVRQNLERFLDERLLQQSGVLCTLVWRVAFLFGSPDQIARAAEICWSWENTLSASIIPLDLASDPVLARNLLLDPGASPQFLQKILQALADRNPAGWGTVDYTPLLTELMRSSASTEVRILSAYAISRWKGDTPIGREAQQVLRQLAETSPAAMEHYKLLQSMGTTGWKYADGVPPWRAETQPASRP